ncbi:MAG TPA: hypothetical protein VFS97_09180 [Nitrososphaeraceae archaeon]|nr:hypothetical protein [Nitrososphaeraceae archaeon]
MTPSCNVDNKLEQFLDKAVKLDVFGITKTDANGNAEQIDFTKKFGDYLLNDGLIWILENRNTIRA